MDRTSALESVPEPYGEALRLRAAGADAAAISAVTGVPLDALETFLVIGERKLAALLALDDTAP